MAVHASTIKNLALFRDLPDTAVRELSNVCVPRTFKKDGIIYLRGGAEGKVFVVLSGGVKIYVAGAGQRIVIQVFKAGEFFGDLTFVSHPSGLPAEEFAQAAEDTQVCVLSVADLTRMLGAHPAFAMLLLVTLRNRLHQAQSKIRDLAVSSAPTRILNELIRYASSHGKERQGFYEIEERLTHQSLAEMSGLARETTTKTLGELEKQGFVSYTPERRLRLNINKITEECAECVILASKQNSAGN